MILGIDLEGAVGLVTEVGLSDGTQTLSCQWTPASKGLTKRLAKEAGLIVGHYIVGFDAPALAQEGVHLDRSKVADTVTAFALLYPHHLKRLGVSAPLCAPFEPWKHLDKSDPPAYNRGDAQAPVAMWYFLKQRLAKYGMEDLFWNLEMPMTWLLHDLQERGIWYGDPPSRDTVRYIPETTGKGPYTSLTGRLQSVPQVDWPGGQRVQATPLVAPPDGRLYGMRRRHLARDVVEVLSESTLSVTDDAIDLHIEGYGPVQINDRLPSRMKGIKAHLSDWDNAHPDYVKWVDRVERQVAKDGYVANPFGRRCWTRDGQKGRQFLVASTVSDIWKTVALKVPDSLYALMPDGLILTSPKMLKPVAFPEIAPDFRLTLSTEAL